MSALGSILLKKSNVAGLRIFAKNPKQEAIADSFDGTEFNWSTTKAAA